MAARGVILVLLLVSLTANATIGFKLLRDPRLPSGAAPTIAPARTTAAPTTATASAERTVPTSPVSADRPAWAHFETRDPAVLAARMRAAGFSVPVAKAAVRTLLWDLANEERGRELAARPLEPFWVTTSGQRDSGVDRAQSRAFAAREHELRRLFPEDATEIVQLQARFGRLPPEKLVPLSLLERDYNDMRSDLLRAGSPGLRMPWTADQLRVIEDERQRDLAALLTPAEMEQYNLRASSTAQAMHRQLAPFGPSEQEFRDIYRLRAEFDRQFGNTGGPVSREAAEARRRAEQAMDANLRSVLGPERYADYTRSLDSGYQAAYAITRERGLPASATAAAYEMQVSTQQRAGAIRADRSRTPQQKAADMSALMSETANAFRGILTEDGWADYRQRAFWLRNIERQATTPGS
ncbi:MAG TPA: hypothetical protein VEB66_16345 [Opitutaceae bacterium]|nr:hypothetical protein [Opitutaceae bacterium]